MHNKDDNIEFKKVNNAKTYKAATANCQLVSLAAMLGMNYKELKANVLRTLADKCKCDAGTLKEIIHSSKRGVALLFVMYEIASNAVSRNYTTDTVEYIKMYINNSMYHNYDTQVAGMEKYLEDIKYQETKMFKSSIVGSLAALRSVIPAGESAMLLSQGHYKVAYHEPPDKGIPESQSNIKILDYQLGEFTTCNKYIDCNYTVISFGANTPINYRALFHGMYDMAQWHPTDGESSVDMKMYRSTDPYGNTFYSYVSRIFGGLDEKKTVNTCKRFKSRLPEIIFDDTYASDTDNSVFNSKQKIKIIKTLSTLITEIQTHPNNSRKIAKKDALLELLKCGDLGKEKHNKDSKTNDVVNNINKHLIANDEVTAGVFSTRTKDLLKDLRDELTTRPLEDDKTTRKPL